ncbi:hypothetical protein [Streptacidiphilus sp. PAMC 29251]
MILPSRTVTLSAPGALTRANTQPAFTRYLAAPGDSHGHPAGLLVLTLAGDRLSALTLFLDLDQELPTRFGLPASLAM